MNNATRKILLWEGFEHGVMPMMTLGRVPVHQVRRFRGLGDITIPTPDFSNPSTQALFESPFLYVGAGLLLLFLIEAGQGKKPYRSRKKGGGKGAFSTALLAAGAAAGTYLLVTSQQQGTL